MEEKLEKKQRQGFVLGALILAVSGFLGKVFGAIFKIPLTNMVGTAAMGYFSSAYSVYVFLLAIATSGIPVGLAALISRYLALERYKDLKSLMRMTTIIFVCIGAVFSALGMIFAKDIAIIMNSEKAYYCVLLLMPAVFFISIVSIHKGFFQGYNNMMPTAISNIIEAFSKLVFGCGIAYLLNINGFDNEITVAGAIGGVTIGTILASIFMFFRYIFRNKSYRITQKDFMSQSNPTPDRQILSEFIKITFPVTISSVAVNLFSMVDAFFVVNRLKAYLDINTSEVMWGSYSNIALTIFNLPSFLVISIGISLIPSIAAAYAKNEHESIKNTVNKALKYSSILAFGCAFGLNAVAEQAIKLFFNTSSNELVIATQLLEIISFALIAVGLTNVTASILQSVGKAYLSVVSVAIGAVIKTICTFTFVGIPSINILGAPIATNIAYPIMLLLNFIFIFKYVKILPNFMEVFLKPLLAGFLCFLTAKGSLMIFENIIKGKLLIFPVILLSVLVYFAAIFLLKLVTFDEIKQIIKKR